MRLRRGILSRGSSLALAFVIANTALFAPSLKAEGGKSAFSAPGFDFAAGALIGLEEPLRGGMAAFGIDFEGIPLLQTVRLALVGDAGLSTWALEPSLGLGLGGEVALIVGLVRPLGEARVGAESGARLRLSPLSMPSLFGIETRLSKHDFSSRLALSIVASIVWRVWDIAAVATDGAASETTTGYASDDALRVFCAGFTASLLARLEVRPWFDGMRP